jgi:hypothetical protein
MFRKLTFALLATAALGATALAPTAASAHGGGGGFTAGAFTAGITDAMLAFVGTFVVIGATGVGGTGPVGATTTRINAAQSEAKTPDSSHSFPAGAPAFWSLCDLD